MDGSDTSAFENIRDDSTGDDSSVQWEWHQIMMQHIFFPLYCHCRSLSDIHSLFILIFEKWNCRISENTVRWKHAISWVGTRHLIFPLTETLICTIHRFPTNEMWFMLSDSLVSYLFHWIFSFIDFLFPRSKDHIRYDEHQCPAARRKNVQVPVCPLCNKGVPSANRDLSPNRVISEHIDRDCKSDPALKKRQKVYSNKCSYSCCKQREVIQVKCDKCLQTFCLKHRFAEDHKCQGFQNTGRTVNRAG